MRKLRTEELQRLSPADYREASKLPVAVILDQVRSMHNVGSVFRTADAFRIGQLWLCGITPRPPHREIHKTALGAEDTVPWHEAPDAASAASALKSQGYRILCIEQTDRSIPLPALRLDPQQPVAVVFGHEIDGVSEAVLALADAAVEIPQHGTKHSLNVSVAAGIVLYALAQQLGS